MLQHRAGATLSIWLTGAAIGAASGALIIVHSAQTRAYCCQMQAVGAA